MKKEIEARLLECDVDNFIKKLDEVNAEFIGDWLQIRKCYDFNPIKENSWIRLRTNGLKTTLTIKEINNDKMDGTKELEIEVSDFDTTDELLNKLGYYSRSHQENRRIQYILDGVEIDIDTWPLIPSYVEFEGKSEEDIIRVCGKLGIDIDKLTTLDVVGIYKYYGYNLMNMNKIVLERKR